MGPTSDQRLRTQLKRIVAAAVLNTGHHHRIINGLVTGYKLKSFQFLVGRQKIALRRSQSC